MAWYNGASIERLDTMHETEWDIQEVKRLKKKQLVQQNLLMLLLFVLFAFYVHNVGSASVLLGLCCVLLWLTAVPPLYTLKTGEPIGTKTSRMVQAFDRYHWGEKRWKRNTMMETGILMIGSVVFTVLFFVWDVDSIRLDSPIGVFPFIGGWIGFNAGQIIRLMKL
ncbi:hypothetical protein [Salibacterium halotolerans]|nr:hypothetical protein [Salibacterium halotolerans]